MIGPFRYLDGTGGQTTVYSDELIVGETVELIVSITNRKHKAQTSTVILILNGVRIRTEIVDVLDEETWERRVTFTRLTRTNRR